MRDYAQTKYLTSDNKKVVTVDYGGSKHPLNDSKYWLKVLLLEDY